MVKNTIVPHLMMRNAAGAIEFYKKSLGFTEVQRMLMPDGKILHCAMRFGDQTLMLNDEFPEQRKSPETLGGSCVTIHLNVDDVDAVFAKAVAGGATATMLPADTFWGARYGQFTDPFGHHWSLSTHKEDVSPAELKKRVDAMFSKKK